MIKALVTASTLPTAQLAELMNIGRDEPVGLTRVGIAILDRPTYALIAERRREAGLAERQDIMSLLMAAETEAGQRLSDRELRDELLTLVLAGHETTANSLAWTWSACCVRPRPGPPSSTPSAPDPKRSGRRR